MSNELRTTINLGVNFLDETVPFDWRKNLDLVKLDMADPQRCVIGQTFCHELLRGEYGAWHTGTLALGEYVDDMYLELEPEHEEEPGVIYFGFERPQMLKSAELEYAILQSAWVMRALLPTSHVVAQA